MKPDTSDTADRSPAPGISGAAGHSRTPDISVIIPVYRDDEGLSRCLEALGRQTLGSDRFEVIVVNNDPGTPLELDPAAGEEVDPRVTEESARGSYAARNAGIRLARGKILAFTDADCVPSPEWLAAGAALLEGGEADLVAGNVEFFFENPPPNACEYVDAATKLNQRAYAEAGFGATANLFVRRQVIDACGPFDAELQSGGDYEFGRRATDAGFSIVYSPEAAVRHPARSSFRAMLRKSVRVARGQKELESRGLLQHGRITPRKLLPLVRVPRPATGHTLSPGAYLKAVGMMNVRRYLNIWIRWFG